MSEQVDINSQKIAFFDSGIGGLTVFSKVKKLLPNEDYIYFGDLKNNPYGEKSKKELIKITDKVFSFFEEQNVKAVIMACNTTSANTYEELKDKYKFKIYPIIQCCAGIISKIPAKRIGILATEATIKSGVYSGELKKHNSKLETFEMACPPWVGIVEDKQQKEAKSVACVESYLGQILQHHPDKIILGCTHYPYLLGVLGKFAPQNLFIDPSEYFAEFIKNDLESNGLLNKKISEGSEEFFVSANPDKFMKAGENFYKLKESPKLLNL